MYFGKKGEPLTLEEWGRVFEDIEYRRVGYDEIAPTTRYPASYVSTVWLGLDHNLFPNGPPLIFETMRFEQVPTQDHEITGRKFHQALEFPSSDPPHDYVDQERYSTEEQASLGHKAIVRLIQEKEMQ